MTFKDYDFQNNAVNKLYDSYISTQYGDQLNNVTILQAPTGAGKTAILVKLMDRIIESDESQNIAFIWLTPGAGELEEQSWLKTSENSVFVKPRFLMDSLTDGFESGTVTFLNWELINNKKNIALRNGERTNLPEGIRSANERLIKFILIVDEEHRNQTEKSQRIIDMFDASMIIKASATPIEENNAKYVIVPEEDVISAGLITRLVVLNDQFNGAGNQEELYSDDEDFLDIADDKRKKIKADYTVLQKDINPLVLIQFPDEKKSKSEVDDKIEKVKDYLVNELGQKEEEIAIWLSGQHSNIQDISANNSKINYLLMKQAVSTGWDAPRAKILVKLRLNTSHNFTIQTIGRIRRMPEQHYYDDELLDNSFVYSNDSKYVYEIIKQGMGTGVTQMSLNSEVKPDIFNVSSRKVIAHPYKDVGAVTHALRDEFVKEFSVTADVKQNESILKQYKWEFGRKIYTSIRTGSVSKLEELAEKTQEITTAITISNTRDWGFRYDAVMSLIKPYLHVGDDIRNIRAIINDLFAVGDPGSDIEPLLQLRPKDRYAFVINNAVRLRDVAKNMDSNYSDLFTEQLRFDDSNTEYIKFELPVRDAYNDNGEKGDVLEKNVYSGYSTSNLVKQSGPEISIEKELNSSNLVKWFYRSKDHGSKYFSISYDMDTRDFYPDYLVKSTNGTTFIIETKGAEGSNIDPYAKLKFEALKEYVENKCATDVRFAFVRPSLKHKGVLLFNNTQWDEKVDDSACWQPLENLFK